MSGARAARHAPHHVEMEALLLTLELTAGAYEALLDMVLTRSVTAAMVLSAAKACEAYSNDVFCAVGHRYGHLPSRLSAVLSLQTLILMQLLPNWTPPAPAPNVPGLAEPAIITDTVEPPAPAAAGERPRRRKSDAGAAGPRRGPRAPRPMLDAAALAVPAEAGVGRASADSDVAAQWLLRQWDYQQEVSPPGSEASTPEVKRPQDIPTRVSPAANFPAGPSDPVPHRHLQPVSGGVAAEPSQTTPSRRRSQSARPLPDRRGGDPAADLQRHASDGRPPARRLSLPKHTLAPLPGPTPTPKPPAPPPDPPANWLELQTRVADIVQSAQDAPAFQLSPSLLLSHPRKPFPPGLPVREANIARGRERLAVRLQWLGLREEPMAADGNCQFRALSHQLWGSPDHHRWVRLQVVDHLRTHFDRYRAFFDGDGEGQAYLRRMEDADWGDEMTLRGFADRFGVTVHVVMSTSSRWYHRWEPEPPPPAPRHAVLTYLSPVHYNAVVLHPAQAGRA